MTTFPFTVAVLNIAVCTANIPAQWCEECVCECHLRLLFMEMCDSGRCYFTFLFTVMVSFVDSVTLRFSDGWDSGG